MLWSMASKSLGITFASFFYLFGNIPVVKDWLIINVTDSHISFFINFNTLFDIPSFPKLYLEFKLSIMFIVVLRLHWSAWNWKCYNMDVLNSLQIIEFLRHLFVKQKSDLYW